MEHSFESIEKSLNTAFEKGLISSKLLEKSLEELDLIKGGKKAMVGEIRDFGGKKFKKQPNGKWLEVSDRGMTKNEHNIARQHQSHSSSPLSYQKELEHEEAMKKLSDKEHSDDEVMAREVKR